MAKDTLAALSVHITSDDARLFAPREPFYANRVLRLLTKTAFAQQFGTDAFALCAVTVMQEDAIRYRRPVGFYCSQLLPLLGFAKWERLNKARRIAIEAGWLLYVPGSRNRAGLYRVIIPPELDGLDDHAIDEATIPFEGYQAGYEAGYRVGWDAAQSALTIPFEGDQHGIETGIKSESKRISTGNQEGHPPSLVPTPQIPSSSSNWGKVKGELIESGIKAPQKLIELAQEHGYSPRTVSELIAHCRTRPAAWEPGAIFHRIQNTPPDVVAHEGCWPTPRGTSMKPVESALGPLRAKYETEFRRLSEPHLMELGRRAEIDEAKLAMLLEVGRDAAIRGDDRERLLIELARERGDIPSTSRAPHNGATRDQAG